MCLCSDVVFVMLFFLYLMKKRIVNQFNIKLLFSTQFHQRDRDRESIA